MSRRNGQGHESKRNIKPCWAWAASHTSRKPARQPPWTTNDSISDSGLKAVGCSYKQDFTILRSNLIGNSVEKRTEMRETRSRCCFIISLSSKRQSPKGRLWHQDGRKGGSKWAELYAKWHTKKKAELWISTPVPENREFRNSQP